MGDKRHISHKTPAVVITEEPGTLTLRAPGDAPFLAALGRALERCPDDFHPDWATFSWRGTPAQVAALKRILLPLLREGFPGAPGLGPKGPFTL